jgi:SAM-dependent methyltransferase
MQAGLVVDAAPTYRPCALSVMGVAPEDEFPIARSPSGFAYAAWLPDAAFLRRVYEDSIDHTLSVTGEPWYHRFILDIAAQLLEAAGAGSERLRALDYGCGYGALLSVLACRDIICTGYEPSAQRRTHTTAIEILADADDVARRGPFDLLICTEVLEHMADPAPALRTLRASAAPGAVLLVTVPCCTAGYLDSALAGFAAGQPQPPMFNPWEHLNYFRPEDLRGLLAREGFEVIADLGRSAPARAALQQAGSSGVAALRIAKRLLSAPPSTQLLCRVAA